MKKINILLVISVIIGAFMLSGCEKSEPSLNYLAVQLSKDDSWSIIDKDGNVVVKEEYPADSKISWIVDGAYWVKTGEKFQLFNIENPKKPVIEEEFSSVTTFCSGVAAVSNPNEQIRIIDTKGKTVATLGTHIKRCGGFSKEGYAIYLNQDNLCGIINRKGNEIITATYSDIMSWDDGLIVARKSAEDRDLVIINIESNKTLGEINTEKYDIMTSPLSEGMLVVRDADEDDRPCIVLDKTGKKLFEIKKSHQRFGWNYYVDGYLVFENVDAKYGVANDKGEIVIRPKYEFLVNMGEGFFLAEKGKKWGVIDSEDNTIVDFDYSGYGFKMGDNFVMEDGNSYSLVNKQGKEITSFEAYMKEGYSSVEFVDMDRLSTSAIGIIEEFEKALPISQAVKTIFKSLDIEQAHYSNGLNHSNNIDDKVQMDLKIVYDGNLAKEKTHIVKENDGWFTYERTVSDGWYWSDAIPQKISGTISLTSDAGLNIKDVYKTLLSKISQGHKKISDTTYSKTVSTTGGYVECQTALTLYDSVISIEMVFVRTQSTPDTVPADTVSVDTVIVDSAIAQ